MPLDLGSTAVELGADHHATLPEHPARASIASNTGAHVVWGLIGSHYENAGFEAGKYGFPTSDEYADTGYEKGRRQNFENGYIQMADMTVPLSGYNDGEPPVDARRAPRVPDQSSPSTPTPESETSPPSSQLPGDQSESSPSPQPSLPGYSDPPSSSSSAVPVPAAHQQARQGAIDPAFQYGAPGGGFVAQPATWPFGDFCIFGTQDGPGSACRMNGDNPWQMTMCVAAIIVEAASLIFTASKILKIRSFIKSLGGAKEAFQLWRGATTKADRAAAWAKTGEITKELAAEFLGLATIAKFCG